MHRVKIALLHQSAPPPAIHGQIKPMKAGGYRDSGADIAFALKGRGISVATPTTDPDPRFDDGWTFPDTVEGIEAAIAAGASILWCNTIVYPGHPVDRFRGRLGFIGPETDLAKIVEDKTVAYHFLRDGGFPVPRQVVIDSRTNGTPPGRGPWVMKPVRGRGSQGVHWVPDGDVFQAVRQTWPLDRFGPGIIVEEALPGREITIAVLPPGRYVHDGTPIERQTPWALPAVERDQHVNHVMPYNGDVPIVENSRVISSSTAEIRHALRNAELLAARLGSRAVLRIDARENSEGVFAFFDVNMKPNMTGPGRPARETATSLVGLAAEAIGWDYGDLVTNLARQAWY
ncbi:ATP-grasp domain-containing protein [Sulfobacillus harzensis]|uniref:ATP-grasp domain-containing protein n=1 Tax=Sulfobacillus harzensis TaxID=2729629 RepID=A0A7Y0Q2V8_9FIRM|nr:ATP-grasp domain-containing protein [Sulfobacillus harzensis]NMP22952.1 ATP-grasp domain-containing protein [Sulfobacillus harzensis]